jgi:hypothetical protein
VIVPVVYTKNVKKLFQLQRRSLDHGAPLGFVHWLLERFITETRGIVALMI